MAAGRNYSEEYRRRIERALARGLSRSSQARGHARSGEAPIRRASSNPMPSSKRHFAHFAKPTIRPLLRKMLALHPSGFAVPQRTEPCSPRGAAVDIH